MKRILICVIAALASAGAAIAADWSIRDIEVRVRLQRDGSALITERWDMRASEGTEVYVPRENLGDIEIMDFSVLEGFKRFEFQDYWDTDASLRDKAGKCGINPLGSGVELCWGLGSHGDHVFNVQYRMTNVIKSLNDCDIFHLQLVNSEMAAAPAHVKVTIEAPDSQMDTSWVRLWGFGYEGTTGFESDGTAVFESTDHLSYYSSVIALLRFEKGCFESESVQDREFQEVLDMAMQGADFGSDEDYDDGVSFIGFLSSLLVIYFMFIYPVKRALSGGKLSKRQKRKLLGANPSNLPWYRDIPLKGNIYEADFVLEKLDEKRQSNAIASAIILRLIQDGYLAVRKVDKGKVDIYFNDGADPQNLDDASLGLYIMMKEASGSDEILQDKEFSKWSAKSKNKSAIRTWANRIQKEAKSGLGGRSLYLKDKFTPEGQTEAQHLIGLRNYLKDFTIIEERHSDEVTLWRDYMVYASLFGIADRVAKELKDINPEYFEQVMPYDYTTFSSVLRMTDSLSRSITNARYVAPVSSGTSFSSSSGFGGRSSFGGGGGFSGGGRGGGVR